MSKSPDHDALSIVPASVPTVMMGALVQMHVVFWEAIFSDLGRHPLTSFWYGSFVKPASRRSEYPLEWYTPYIPEL